MTTSVIDTCSVILTDSEVVSKNSTVLDKSFVNAALLLHIQKHGEHRYWLTASKMPYPVEKTV